VCYCSAYHCPRYICSMFSGGGVPISVLHELTSEIERLRTEVAQRDLALSSWKQLLKQDGTVGNRW